jgi:hypothetical protein
MAMFLSPAKQPSNSVTLNGTSPYKKFYNPLEKGCEIC